MALITTAARSELIALYVAMFKAAPGAANLTDMVTAYEAGGTTATIAKTLAAKADFATVYPGFSTGTEFSASLVANLLGSNVTAAITTWAEGYVLGLLNAGKSRADAIVTAVVALRATANTEFTVAQAAMANSVDVASHYSITKAQGTATSTLATLQGVIAGVTSVAATATTAKATIDTAVTAVATAATTAATAAAAVGNTLTTSVQTLTGTAGDDTFNAPAGTWGDGDIVNGGTAGTDTLNATITGTGPTQSATSLVSIEVLNLTASPNPATLNLTGVTGLTQVNNVSSAGGATLSVTGVGNVVNTSITGGTTSTSVAYTTAAIASTTDAATLTLNGTSATSSFTTSGVETLTVNSATAANTLASLTDTGITRLNVTGSQALTVTAAVGSTTIATVDASAATGAITLTTGAGAGGTALTGVTVTAPTAATAGLFTITTSTTNKDTVNLGAGTSLVSTGGGADTINSGAGNATITPGAGNDVVNAGAGVDTIRFDLAPAASNSDTINSFGTTDVMSINLGRAQVTGTSGAPATAVYGSLLTTNGVVATSPTIANVSGTGTGTAIVFQSVVAGSTTANTIAQASNVIALTGAFTDGTVGGAISALGATGQAGVTTQLDSRFFLVTYSVGNIAQVWAYTGDNQVAAANTSVLTDIDAAELTLVATLNGVASGSLTAANFSTYLDVAAVAAAASVNTGQTINIGLPLSQVTTTSNALGQFFTAAADTVTVAVGMLPNALASATAGLTLLDDTAGDGDVLNVTSLSAAALTTATMGTFTSGIETINMNLIVGGGNFAAATSTPGTTTFGFTGTGGQTITAVPATPTFKFDAAASNAVVGTLTTAGAFSVALNGSGVAPVLNATSVAPSLNSNGTTSTTTVTGTSYLQAQVGSFYGAAASAATITGSGNLTISGTGATFGAQVGGTSATQYTGSLTLRPTDAAAAFDLSGAGADTTKFTGVKTIDLAQTSGNTIVLASDNGAFPVTVTSIANFGNLSVTQAGSGVTDALVISATGTGAQTFGTIATPGIETLTVNLQGLATATTAKTVTSITMDINAAPQALTVTSNTPQTTLGTVTADSLNTTGVAGTLGVTLSANLVGGATFTGNTTQASFITGSGFADIITTGSGNDAIYEAAGGNAANSANLNGGLGNDTYSLLSTNSAGTVITDANGVDTLALTGATANISGMNNGGTLASMGIDVLITNGAGVVTVASNQIGNQTINTLNGTAQTPAFTLATAGGVLNVSGANLLVAAAGALTATGGALAQQLAATAFTLTGSANVDTITGSTGNDTITGGAGIDNLIGGW